jgi:hypothetical protein
MSNTPPREDLMIRTMIDDRLRRAWAILIGMSVMAAAVGAVTLVIHDRVQ